MERGEKREMKEKKVRGGKEETKGQRGGDRRSEGGDENK